MHEEMNQAIYIAGFVYFLESLDDANIFTHGSREAFGNRIFNCLHQHSVSPELVFYVLGSESAIGIEAL